LSPGSSDDDEEEEEEGKSGGEDADEGLMAEGHHGEGVWALPHGALIPDKVCTVPTETVMEPVMCVDGSSTAACSARWAGIA
jgi:hypothetical protein